MRFATVTRVVGELKIDRLAVEVDPELLRHEPTTAMHEGLRQAVRHTLRANQFAGTNRVIAGGVELNVLALRDRSGAQLLLLTDHSGHNGESTHPRVTSVPATARPHLALSAWGEPPTFDADLPLNLPNPHHLFAHADRWEGFTTAQVRARIRPAMQELSTALASCRESAVPYFYLDPRDPSRSRWSAVAPLRLDRSAPPFPLVLNAEADRIDVVTVLDRHAAFWNVSATGVQPPRWLDGHQQTTDPKALALAA